ncbi:MAG: hypothetical protein ACT4QC_04495 [Planctomycetaceae bacterium]
MSQERNPPVAVTPDRARPAPDGLAAVSRRIAGRTTDLIAIGVVLIGGLTIGRQVIEWWRDEPAQATAAAPQATGAIWGEGSPLRLDFGNYPLALSRQPYIGDQLAAERALNDSCRRLVETANQPPAAPIEKAEAQLLARTEALEPVAGTDGSWAVYQINEPFGVAVGIRSYAAEKTGGEPVRRLVCLGMALPAAENRWTFYHFIASVAAAGAGGRLPEIALPTGAHRSLAMRDAQGGGLVGFSGTGDPEEWCRFFSGDLRSHGWRTVDGWRAGAGAWSARFEPDGEFTGDEVSVQFSGDAHQGFVGLVQLSPGRRKDISE